MRQSLIVLLLLLPRVVAADHKQVELVTGEFAPFTGTTLPGGGLVTRIIREAFAYENIEISIQFKPWKRGYHETSNGLYTGTFPYSKNLERQQLFLYSDPILSGKTLFYTRKNNPVEYQVIDDLKGSRLCMPLGFNLFAPLKQAITDDMLTLVRASDLEGCFRMIASSRADLTLVREEIANDIIKRVSRSQNIFRAMQQPFSTVSEHLIIPRQIKHAHELIRQFNSGLRKLRTSGQIRQLYRKTAFD